MKPLSGAALVAGLACACVAGCNAILGNGDHELTPASDGGPTSGLDPRCQVFGQAAPNAVMLGAILPMSLPDAGGPDPRGSYRAEAIQLAVSQLNPPVRAGINGAPIQLTICDDSNDPNAGKALATSLVNSGVVAIISASSSDTLAESTVTLPAGVLLISCSATSPEIATLNAKDPQTGVRMVWRTATSDIFQGQVIAETLKGPDAGETPPPKTAVFELNQTYGQGLWSAFSANYPATSASAFLYNQGGGDVPAALAGAGGFAPKVALTIAFPTDAVTIVNGAQSTAGLQGVSWFFTDSSESPSLLQGLEPPNVLEGARGTGPGVSLTSPAYQWFAQEFTQTYNENNLQVGFTTNSFDAAMLLAFAASWAANNGGTIDGPALARGLGQLSNTSGKVVPLDPPDFNTATSEFAAGRSIDVVGASGPLDFNASTGEAPGPMAIWQIVDGGIQTQSYVAP